MPDFIKLYFLTLSATHFLGELSRAVEVREAEGGVSGECLPRLPVARDTCCSRMPTRVRFPLSPCTWRTAGPSRSGSRPGVPGPGLEMQHAILLICFVSSFASLGKVLLLEDENTDGCRAGICNITSYNRGRLTLQLDEPYFGL